MTNFLASMFRFTIKSSACAQLVLLCLYWLFCRDGPRADMVFKPVIDVTSSEVLIAFLEGSLFSP